MTEAQLISRSLQGDEAAAADLVERHAQETFRLALSILDDPTEAEEAAQEAWLKALDHLDAFRGEASFRTWLFTITLNTCRIRLRKRIRRERLQEALVAIFRTGQSLRSHPEEDLLRKERGDQVWEAVQRYPRRTGQSSSSGFRRRGNSCLCDERSDGGRDIHSNRCLSQRPGDLRRKRPKPPGGRHPCWRGGTVGDCPQG
jgi:RNA polymerase sigma factor (sigma-70 family)